MPDRAAQVHAIVADFAARLAPAVRDACKVVNETAAAMAKRAPAIEKAASETFAAFAAAVQPPARKETDRG